jgi:hypothetical protein
MTRPTVSGAVLVALDVDRPLVLFARLDDVVLDPKVAEARSCGPVFLFPTACHEEIGPSSRRHARISPERELKRGLPHRGRTRPGCNVTSKNAALAGNAVIETMAVR